MGFILNKAFWLVYGAIFFHEFIIVVVGIALGFCLGITLGLYGRSKADPSELAAVAPSNRRLLLKVAVVLSILAIGVCLFPGVAAGVIRLTQSAWLSRIETKFPQVKPGMTSGQALKIIFEDALVFPEHSGQGIEKWYIWGYDIRKMIRARWQGSSPFTLTVDTHTDRVIKADYEYNTRFD
jgi:hypothetical protein